MFASALCFSPEGDPSPAFPQQLYYEPITFVTNNLRQLVPIMPIKLSTEASRPWSWELLVNFRLSRRCNEIGKLVFNDTRATAYLGHFGHLGHLGSGLDKGRRAIEWGDCSSVRLFIRPFVRPPPQGHPARPEASSILFCN